MDAIIRWFSDVSNLLVLLGSAGVFRFLLFAARTLKHHRAARSPEGRTADYVKQVDNSLIIVSRARDVLESDNRRLREQLAADAARYEEERRRWDAREAHYRQEIDVLETKVREILSELEALKRRHS